MEQTYKEPTVDQFIDQQVQRPAVEENSFVAGQGTQEEFIDQHIAYEDLSRRDIRALIFNLLYIVDTTEYQESLQSVVDNFSVGYNISIPRHSEAFSVAQQVILQKDVLDEQYEPLLSNWRMDRISVCSKLILRFALWELNNTDVDPRIIINEAIELAKCFAEKDAYKFINGILDKVANKV